MKTTVDLPDSLFAEAKSCAESLGVPFRQLVENGLRSEIERNKHPRKRFVLRDGSFDGEGLRSDMSWPMIRSIIYEGRGE